MGALASNRLNSLRIDASFEMPMGKLPGAYSRMEPSKICGRQPSL